MKSNTFAILLAFLAIVALANAQNSTNTTATSTTAAAAPASTEENKIAKCLKDNNCAGNLDCSAKCAGVPNPSRQDVNSTNDCVAKCNSTLPDANAYKTCLNGCITNNYFDPSKTAVSVPSNTGTSDSSNKTGTSGSGNNTSTGSSSNSSPSSSSSSSSSNHAFNTPSIYSSSVYSVAMLLICVVAGLMSVGL
ncbi:12996_t:CDS:2 [Ambispora gerdemannii]|uniref:12996_t:CDS:1 n=1 Tax=Ambispora gerdemannii TaxID=144530 RepID=A0A9N9D535_9GLOM|nr:12996_t:CDS:2 [Ambispora gerdemannii]